MFKWPDMRLSLSVFLQLALLLFPFGAKGDRSRSTWLCPEKFAAIAAAHPPASPLVLSPKPALARAQILEALEKVVPDGNYPEGAVCRVGGCIQSSAQLLQLLKLAGVDGRRVAVNYELPVRVGRVTIGELVYHYFIVVPLPGGGELVVDGSYLQFLENGTTAKEPPVFVGTREQLTDFFKARRKQVRPMLPETYRGPTPPEALVDLHYGFGASAPRRQEVEQAPPAPRPQDAPALASPR